MIIVTEPKIVAGNNAWNPNANAFTSGTSVNARSAITPTTIEAIAPAAVDFFQYIPNKTGTTKIAIPENAKRLISKILPGWNTPNNNNTD